MTLSLNFIQILQSCKYIFHFQYILIMKQIPLPEKSQRSDKWNQMSQLSQQQATVPQLKEWRFNKKWCMIILFGTLLIFISSLHYNQLKYEQANPEYSPSHELGPKQVIKIKHDSNCYTQGLSYLTTKLVLQSCGIYKNSYFHILEYNDNSHQFKTIFTSPIYSQNIFIEGSVFFPINNIIYILTWREHIVLRINAQTYNQIDRIRWNLQGWGLTHNNSHLIVSDGSSNIYIADGNMNILQTIAVIDQNGRPKVYLNELEWVSVDGVQYVYANVYLTDQIVKIELVSGKIVETHKFADLVEEEQKLGHKQVLNGIGYNAQQNKFIITGKKWEYMYQMNYL